MQGSHLVDLAAGGAFGGHHRDVGAEEVGEQAGQRVAVEHQDLVHVHGHRLSPSRTESFGADLRRRQTDAHQGIRRRFDERGRAADVDPRLAP